MGKPDARPTWNGGMEWETTTSFSARVREGAGGSKTQLTPLLSPVVTYQVGDYTREVSSGLEMNKAFELIRRTLHHHCLYYVTCPAPGLVAAAHTK